MVISGYRARLVQKIGQTAIRFKYMPTEIGIRSTHVRGTGWGRRGRRLYLLCPQPIFR